MKPKFPYAGDDSARPHSLDTRFDISIHVPLRGGRPSSAMQHVSGAGFQSTSPCAGDDMFDAIKQGAPSISIHVPLRGGRLQAMHYSNALAFISIHVPLRGGRLSAINETKWRSIFQSTSPYAGDAFHHFRESRNVINFNPRPPTRGTTSHRLRQCSSCCISIHVPLRGGRLDSKRHQVFAKRFQSTSPYAGDDSLKGNFLAYTINFNPRPPTRGTTAKLYKIFGGFCSLFATIITKRIIRPGIAFAF